MSVTAEEKWFSRADRTLGSAPEVLEVDVEVSGAQLKNDSGVRELFTEHTQTTLVFEDGAVVRLAAAIAVGQMLFLKHTQSQREIVTRVLRQRSGAGCAYVELEFAEPAPGFWSVGAAGSSRSSEPQVSPAEADPDGPAAKLSAQLSSMLGSQSAGPAPFSASQAGPAEAAIAPAVQRKESQNSGTDSPPLPGSSAPASALPRDTTTPAETQRDPAAPADAVPTEEESLGKILARKKRKKETAKSPGPPREASPASRLRLLAAIFILVVLLGTAYQLGLLEAWSANRSVTASTVGSVPGAPRVTPKFAPAPKASAGAGDASDSAPASSAKKTLSSEQSATGESAPRRSAQTAGAESDGPRSSPATNTDGAVAADAIGEGYEPPKLLKSVNAVPPADFVSGDVKFDALVDAAGKVTSAKVVSGQASLQSAALDALGRYEFKPATKNGQPVPGHIIVNVKFWYEP